MDNEITQSVLKELERLDNMEYALRRSVTMQRLFDVNFQVVLTRPQMALSNTSMDRIQPFSEDESGERFEMVEQMTDKMQVEPRPICSDTDLNASKFSRKGCIQKIYKLHNYMGSSDNEDKFGVDETCNIDLNISHSSSEKYSYSNCESNSGVDYLQGGSSYRSSNNTRFRGSTVDEYCRMSPPADGPDRNVFMIKEKSRPSSIPETISEYFNKHDRKTKKAGHFSNDSDTSSTDNSNGDSNNNFDSKESTCIERKCTSTQEHPRNIASGISANTNDDIDQISTSDTGTTNVASTSSSGHFNCTSDRNDSPNNREYNEILRKKIKKVEKELKTRKKLFKKLSKRKEMRSSATSDGKTMFIQDKKDIQRSYKNFKHTNNPSKNNVLFARNNNHEIDDEYDQKEENIPEAKPSVYNLLFHGKQTPYYVNDIFHHHQPIDENTTNYKILYTGGKKSIKGNHLKRYLKNQLIKEKVASELGEKYLINDAPTEMVENNKTHGKLFTKLSNKYYDNSTVNDDKNEFVGDEKFSNFNSDDEIEKMRNNGDGETEIKNIYCNEKYAKQFSCLTKYDKKGLKRKSKSNKIIVKEMKSRSYNNTSSSKSTISLHSLQEVYNEERDAFQKKGIKKSVSYKNSEQENGFFQSAEHKDMRRLTKNCENEESNKTSISRSTRSSNTLQEIYKEEDQDMERKRSKNVSSRRSLNAVSVSSKNSRQETDLLGDENGQKLNDYHNEYFVPLQEKLQTLESFVLRGQNTMHNELSTLLNDECKLTNNLKLNYEPGQNQIKDQVDKPWEENGIALVRTHSTVNLLREPLKDISEITLNSTVKTNIDSRVSVNETNSSKQKIMKQIYFVRKFDSEHRTVSLSPKTIRFTPVQDKTVQTIEKNLQFTPDLELKVIVPPKQFHSSSEENSLHTTLRNKETSPDSQMKLIRIKNNRMKVVHFLPSHTSSTESSSDNNSSEHGANYGFTKINNIHKMVTKFIRKQ